MLATTVQCQVDTWDETTVSVASAMSVLCGYKDQRNLAIRPHTTAAATLGWNLARFTEEQHRPTHDPDLLQISTYLTWTHSQALPTTDATREGECHIKQAVQMSKTVTASTSSHSNQCQLTYLNHSLAVMQGYQELYPIKALITKKLGPEFTDQLHDTGFQVRQLNGSSVVNISICSCNNY